ncbi:uncharacterized protein F5891DRAFT_978252 [Suillus fuscotomentosus]|uniref:Uncharacterized protein n=1 Tax=Suillus fuscotomentosus TaxID=1912939 RepID=A0AAD4HNA1_9AGAM|nr:uncharacterized protein F5891DRAFT_978252 [Suillus fuscotomentosus]KAG1902757.1 hypothetical protein F5891DRAFT_978252 [Suillus fuscotomentosus]
MIHVWYHHRTPAKIGPCHKKRIMSTHVSPTVTPVTLLEAAPFENVHHRAQTTQIHVLSVNEPGTAQKQMKGIVGRKTRAHLKKFFNCLNCREVDINNGACRKQTRVRLKNSSTARIVGRQIRAHLKKSFSCLNCGEVDINDGACQEADEGAPEEVLQLPELWADESGEANESAPEEMRAHLKKFFNWWNCGEADEGAPEEVLQLAELQMRVHLKKFFNCLNCGEADEGAPKELKKFFNCLNCGETCMLEADEGAWWRQTRGAPEKLFNCRNCGEANKSAPEETLHLPDLHTTGQEVQERSIVQWGSKEPARIMDL